MKKTVVFDDETWQGLERVALALDLRTRSVVQYLVKDFLRACDPDRGERLREKALTSIRSECERVLRALQTEPKEDEPK